MLPNKIEFGFDEEDECLTHPKGAPFDEKPCLLQYQNYWTTGWWIPEEGEGENAEGFCWYIECSDEQVEYDEVKAWLPLPPIIEDEIND